MPQMTQILRHVELIADRIPVPGEYPFTIPAVAQMGRLDLDPAVTFFVGENGSGKSTLIEAIAIKAGFNPEGGSKHFSTSQRPSESTLDKALQLVRGSRRESSGFFLRAETMFNVSTEAEAYAEYGWENLHEMSHGEAFLWVAMHRFREGGLYVLDEPEAALSPQRQLALLARVHELVVGGCQFIVSTHSPILMAYPRATIYHLDDRGIQEVEYKDTSHYQLTRSFLDAPERMLRHVTGEAQPDPP